VRLQCFEYKASNKRRRGETHTHKLVQSLQQTIVSTKRRLTTVTLRDGVTSRNSVVVRIQYMGTVQVLCISFRREEYQPTAERLEVLRFPPVFVKFSILFNLSK